MTFWIILSLIIITVVFMPVVFIYFNPPNIARLKATGDIPGLIKALSYQSRFEDASEIRKKAALALGYLGHPAAVEPLAVTLSNPAEEKKVRLAAATALGQMKDSRAVTPLMTAFTDPAVDQAAIPPLKELGRVAEPVFTSIIKNGSLKMQQTAVILLGKIGQEWAALPLTEALQAEEPEIKATAAGSITELGSVAIRPLSQLLQHGNPDMRRLAAEKLAEIGGDKIDEVLKEALKDSNSEVRLAVARALDEIKWFPATTYEMALYKIAKQQWAECITIGEAIVDPLITVLKGSGDSPADEAIRAQIIRIIEQIGSPAVHPLLDQLTKPGINRQVVYELLGDIGDRQAVEPLVVALEKEKPANRLSLVTALDKLGWVPDKSQTAAIYWITKQGWANCIEIGSPAETPLIELIKDSVSPEAIRHRAALTLQQIMSPENAEALANYWISRREWSRCVVIGVPAIPPLTKALREPGMDTRIAAIETLSQMGIPEVIVPLLNAVEDDTSVLIQEKVVNALVTVGPSAVQPLIEIVSDKTNAFNDQMVRPAVEALGIMEEKSAAAPLMVRYQRTNHNALRLRNSIIVALGEIGDPAATKLISLVAENKHERWGIRQSAIEALATMRDPSGVSALMSILSDWSELGQIREIAATALGQIGDKKAAAVLINTLRDKGQVVRLAAAKALLEISGEDYGIDEVQWQLWLKNQSHKN
jgi:HEAT repeat protein